MNNTVIRINKPSDIKILQAIEPDRKATYLEATLLASDGGFLMRVYFSSEEEYVQNIASLMKACPSAVSVSVREV